MQLRSEAVWDRLRLARRNLQTNSCCGQVAHNLRRVGSTGNSNRRDKRAADDGDSDRLRLLVGDLEDCARGMAIDQLDAEDLGLREGGADVDVQLGRLDVGIICCGGCGGGIVGYLFNLFDLGGGQYEACSTSWC